MELFPTVPVTLWDPDKTDHFSEPQFPHVKWPARANVISGPPSSTPTTPGTSGGVRTCQNDERHGAGTSRDRTRFFPSTLRDTEMGNTVPSSKTPMVLLGRWENPWQRVASFLSPESALSTSAGGSKRTRPHLDGPAGQESQTGEDHQQRPGDSREHQGPGPLESMHTETCSALLTQGRTRALHFEVTKFLLMTLKCFLTTFYKSTSSFLSQNSTRNLIRRQ